MSEFPPSLSVPLNLKSKLRYGEHPHQRAAFYEDKSLCEFGSGDITTSLQYHGKTLVRQLREFRRLTDGETRMFYEIVVAPSYTGKSLEILTGKSKLFVFSRLSTLKRVGNLCNKLEVATRTLLAAATNIGLLCFLPNFVISDIEEGGTK